MQPSASPLTEAAPATASPVNLQAELLQVAATVLDVLILHLLLNMLTGTQTYIALWPLLVVALGSHMLAAYLESSEVPSPAFELVLGGAAVGSYLVLVWSQFFPQYDLWDVRWIGTVLGSIIGFRYPIGPLVGMIPV